MAISMRPSFKREIAVSDLNDLAAWKDDYQKFVSQPGLKRIFGHHFRDIDTDFVLFSGLLDFYEAVDQEFPNIENLPLRRLLKTGDIELLNSIPTTGTVEWSKTFTELGLEIARLTERQQSARENLGELSALIRKIKYPERLSLGELNELRLSNQTYRLTKSELEDARDIGALLREKFLGTQTEAKSFAPIRTSNCPTSSAGSIPNSANLCRRSPADLYLLATDWAASQISSTLNLSMC